MVSLLQPKEYDVGVSRIDLVDAWVWVLLWREGIISVVSQGKILVYIKKDHPSHVRYLLDWNLGGKNHKAHELEQTILYMSSYEPLAIILVAYAGPESVTIWQIFDYNKPVTVMHLSSVHRPSLRALIKIRRVPPIHAHISLKGYGDNTKEDASYLCILSLDLRAMLL